MEDLVGKKVRGFKFEGDYSSNMNKHIGEIGEIISVSAVLKRVRIEFATASWSYPADQIEKHLVKELSKSFACTNTNQELWDKYIKWLNKEHNASIVGKSLDCPYYGIDKDGIVNNHSSKHDFDTILSLEEWDEIVNPKSKELPKSFACINTNQELWDKYISWFNTTYKLSIYGDSDVYPYYGITTNGVYGYHTSINFFDTILSLEEWNEMVNGTETKTEETMKNYTIKREQLKEIHDVACNSWKNTIEIYGIRNPFGNTIEITQTEVDGMFKAATVNQIPVLEGIFGKQTVDIDLSTGKVDGKGLFNNSGDLTNALITVRTHGHYKNKAFILNSDFNWNIWGDDNGQLCLVPTRK